MPTRKRPLARPAARHQAARPEISKAFREWWWERGAMRITTFHAPLRAERLPGRGAARERQRRAAADDVLAKARAQLAAADEQIIQHQRRRIEARGRYNQRRQNEAARIRKRALPIRDELQDKKSPRYTSAVFNPRHLPRLVRVQNLPLFARPSSRRHSRPGFRPSSGQREAPWNSRRRRGRRPRPTGDRVRVCQPRQGEFRRHA